MKKKLILHIGHYKTGTTALQVFCDRNARALARLGLSYARARRNYCKHSPYAYSLLRAAGADTLLHGFSSPLPPEAFWAGLFAEIRASAAPVTLISSEEFMRLGAYPAAGPRLAAILATAPDIEMQAIAYLRPVQSHLRSWHNQLVKLGLCEIGFAEAVRTRIEPVHYDYALALRPWVEALGPGGLILRPYDDRLRRGSRIYRDFFQALGLALPPWPVLPQSDPNPRLDDGLVDAARAANALRLASAGRPAAPAGAAAPDFADIRARAEAGLREVARLAGPGFPLARFLDALPEPPGPDEAARTARVDRLIHEHAAPQGATEAELNHRIAALQARLSDQEGG